jgi:hypothetical protein
MSCIDNIQADIDWRMAELGSLKSIPLRYKLLPHHQAMIIKYTVPSIYALWEGFVKETFRFYSSDINACRLHAHEVHINLLVHGLTSIDKLKLENVRNSFKTKKEFTQCYLDVISQPLQLTNVIRTNSNVSFEIINELLQSFNLKELPTSYKKPLAKLLNYRNSVAHGDSKLPATIEDIVEFTRC